MTRAIIVDDEPNLVDYLQEKLKRLWPQLEIVGTAANGASAIELAKEVAPDIAFLDIHMPGLSGLQVAEQLEDNIKIVFVTAFDQYAIKAFNNAAIDYLLKPVSDERLAVCIKRLDDQSAQNREVLLQALRSLTPEKVEHLQWLRTGLDTTTQLINTDEVYYFKAEQKYTTVVTANKEHLIRRSIKELEEQLDPNQFWRIHRGIIVRVDQILSATRDIRGRYTLKLRDCPDKLRTSQSYGHLFKQM